MKNTNRFQNETGFFIIYCDMSKLTDMMVLYYKKMDEMNAKISEFQEKIAEIIGHAKAQIIFEYFHPKE